MLDEFVASFAADEEKGSGSKTFVRGETFVPHTVLDKASATSTASSGKLYKPAPKIKTVATKQEAPAAVPLQQDKSSATRSIDELKDMFIKCAIPGL